MERLLRVCVFGPESTGKSTLCSDLAEHFDTVWVREFARDYLEAKDGEFVLEDVPLIASGQLKYEQQMTPAARRVLFCDTDLLTTTLWSDWFFQQCPREVRRQAEAQQFDLTLLTSVDVPWVQDSVRYLPEHREQFQLQCEQALQRLGRNYFTVQGDWSQRFKNSVTAVEALLNAP